MFFGASQASAAFREGRRWTQFAWGMRFAVNRTHPDRRVGLIGLYGGNVAAEIRSTGL